MLRKVVVGEDAMEMSRDELQSWIRDQVKQNELISPDLLKKCNLLDSLLQRRKKQVADLVEFSESVAACEETVKKLYSLLGWEYSDTDSDSDEDDGDSRSANCQTPPSSSETDDSRDYSPTRSNGPSLLTPKLEDNDSLQRDNRKTTNHILTKELKVVLTRLPASVISDALPQPPLQTRTRPRSRTRPTPQKHCSEDEFLSSAESDNLWEPEGDSSDSDFNISTFNAGSNKRRKINTKNGKCNWSHAAPQASTNSAETSTPTTSKNICAKNNVAETTTSQASGSTDVKSNTTTATTTTPPPSQVRTDSNANSQEKKTSTVPATTKVTGATSTTVPVQLSKTIPVQSSATVPARSSTAAPLKCQPPTNTPPTIPPKEISVNMTVIAKKKSLCWKRGTVVELITKDDKVKYKINFEKGKSLVSGHHVAFDEMPKVDRLFVGARVIVRSQADEAEFVPGIMAEIPTRRNRMRFLVFTDDHTPMYVGLPVLRLVYKALTDPLDDIKDENHRYFMQEYMKSWPYPPQTQYKIGQTISVERNGVQQKCEVLLIDCSLIEVVFLDDKHKEWVYRGSIRLEHMVNMRDHLEMKKKQQS